MKLDSFYEALRRNLARLQPEFSDSDWERFQETNRAPAIPLWKTGWVRAVAALVLLGGLAAVVHWAYMGKQNQLEQRVQALTRQRDSLLSAQVPRPTAATTSPDTAWVDSASGGVASTRDTLTKQAFDSAANRVSAPAPGTQSFDDWFNSVLEKNPVPTVIPEPDVSRPAKAPVRVRKLPARKRAKVPGRDRQVVRARRVVPPPTPTLSAPTELISNPNLTVERTQTLDLNLLPTPPIRLLPVTPPALPEVSYESARQQLDSAAPSSSVPSP